MDEYTLKRQLEAVRRDLERVEDDRAYFQRNYPSHAEAFRLFDKRIAALRVEVSDYERALSNLQTASPWSRP